ncbi:MAG: hypothetical protein PHW13_13735, partial [Methylococcales bacterium]|nr:hypothetical protein [Methylococcales bacterium]
PHAPTQIISIRTVKEPAAFAVLSRCILQHPLLLSNLFSEAAAANYATHTLSQTGKHALQTEPPASQPPFRTTFTS